MTSPDRFGLLVLLAGTVFVLTTVPAAQSGTQSGGRPTSPAAVHIDAAKQAQQKRELARAVAEYRLAVEADPDNADAHAGFISALQSLEYGKAGLDKAQTTAERRTAFYAGRVAAEKMLSECYRALEAQYPRKAAVQWALGRIHGEDPARAEASYRKAVALDPGFARAYLEIGRLAQQADDRAKAAAFYRKASQADAASDYDAYLYATSLKPIDRGQFATAVEELLGRFPKSEWAARALADSAEQVSPTERVQRYERLQRDFPDSFRGYATVLFAAYVSAGSLGRATEFARARLALTSASGEQDQWKRRVAYAEAVAEARRLQAEAKPAEACAFIDKTLAEQSPEPADSERLQLIWADAARVGGNRAAAIERLVDVYAARPTREVAVQLDTYRASAKRTLEEIDRAIWDRRTKMATPMADFELARLDTGAKVHLADLRGKVVLVNFWFPT